MILMVILMLLPVMALPVFWLLPLGQAIPIYVVCLLLSGFMFLVMIGSMKQKAKTGVEGLIGKQVTVISESPSDVLTPYRVRIQDEIWRARSEDALQEGETAIIVAVEGNKLTVKRNGEN